MLVLGMPTPDLTQEITQLSQILELGNGSSDAGRE